MSWLNFLGVGSDSTESLRDIFPIPIEQKNFVAIDVQNIYTRILTDSMERTQGIPDEKKSLIWDNCLASEKQDGLVTLIAKAMVAKSELFLVFITATNVVRKATSDETQKIRDGYKLKAEPVSIDGGTGLYVTFKNFLKSDMVQFYSALEYCAVGGLWKQANLSKSIQIKINDLRGSVSLGDSATAKAQAKAMADGMADGKDILTDAKDIIETLTPDLTASNATLELIARKQSFYLGMPASYFSGELATSSLSDTGKADKQAVERGLKGYYFSIVKPILDGLFGIKSTFKSENAETLETALKVLESFDRTSNEHLGADNKTLIVNQAFGLDEDEVGDGPEPDPTMIDPATGQPMIPPKPGAAPPVPPKPGAKPPPPK